MPVLLFKKVALFLLIPFICIFAAPVGNPSQPVLQKMGIIDENPSWWSFRIGYLGDYVYNQSFRDEFKIQGVKTSLTDMQLWTQSGVITFNIRNRIDLYAILGSSRMQLDKEMTTQRNFAWGMGAKVILFHSGRLRGGVDVKYFQTHQKPLYFISDHFAYNVVSPYLLKYHEFQFAFGLSFRSKYCSPFVNATYLIAKIKPDPLIALVRLPTMDLNVDVPSKSVMGTKRWGLTVGVSLIDSRKATLAAEWRGFNQNSVSVTGELRF